MKTITRTAAAAWIALAAGCASLPKAAHDGNRAAVEEFLAKGGPVDQRFDDMDGCTLLHPAADGGQVEVATMLLERGADPNAVGPEGYTPLHFAAGHQDVAMARLLLMRGGGPSLAVRDRHGNTPLILAAATVKETSSWTMTNVGAVAAGTREPEPSQELIGLLLDAGADVRATTAKGNTALHIAAYKGYVNTVRLLLARGASRDARNQGGETPAMLAARYEQAEVVRVLQGQ